MYIFIYLVCYLISPGCRIFSHPTPPSYLWMSGGFPSGSRDWNLTKKWTCKEDKCPLQPTGLDWDEENDGTKNVLRRGERISHLHSVYAHMGHLFEWSLCVSPTMGTLTVARCFSEAAAVYQPLGRETWRTGEEPNRLRNDHPIEVHK